MSLRPLEIDVIMGMVLGIQYTGSGKLDKHGYLLTGLNWFSQLGPDLCRESLSNINLICAT